MAKLAPCACRLCTTYFQSRNLYSPKGRTGQQNFAKFSSRKVGPRAFGHQIQSRCFYAPAQVNPISTAAHNNMPTTPACPPPDTASRNSASESPVSRLLLFQPRPLSPWHFRGPARLETFAPQCHAPKPDCLQMQMKSCQDGGLRPEQIHRHPCSSQTGAANGSRAGVPEDAPFWCCLCAEGYVR